MSITLPLDEMSTAEKLAAMEALWSDLSQDPENIPVPDWHRDVLHQRERDIENGNDNFTDWETAKTEIRNSLS